MKKNEAKLTDNIIVESFHVKFYPPQIGVMYKRNTKDKKKRLY